MGNEDHFNGFYVRNVGDDVDPSYNRGLVDPSYNRDLVNLPRAVTLVMRED